MMKNPNTLGPVTAGIPKKLRKHRETAVSKASVRRQPKASLEFSFSLKPADIARHLDTPIGELSVGQQQRVAAARALIGSPEVVIADEPTSALDTDRREQFLELLFRSCEKVQATLVFVSHDHTLMPLFSRIVELAEINTAAKSGRAMAVGGAAT